MTRLSLNGLWCFSVTQDPQYHQAYDYSQPTSLRYWEQAPVPGCWNLYDARYDMFEGVAWFVKEFDLAELPEDAIARLDFGGVNYIADVYLNGTHLGCHEGGYTAFTIDASQAICSGTNRLAVRVDNRNLKIRLPAVLGWYNYGGIHRDVTLTVTSGAQITALRVRSMPEGDGALGTVEIESTQSARTLNTAVRLFDSEGACVWEGQAEGSGQWSLPFILKKASKWSSESPTLYSCRVELRDGNVDLHSRTCTFGIRGLDVDGQRILHNGKPLHLRGMCYLYDHPATGVTCNPDVIARDLDDIAQLGVNCLRSHFPLPEHVLDECDRRGIMLWLEVPIYCIAPSAESCGSTFSENSVQALALQMLREMVEQAINHPSVILWSVGNECNTEHPEALAFFRACVDQVRDLDDTRLISYAALYGGVGCAADLVDVISINEYWGWYDRISYDGAREQEPPVLLPLEIPELEECLAEQSMLNKPIILTEFGADSVPGYSSAACDLWSEDYHAELLKTQLRIAARFPAVCGTFPFLYADYRDPSKPINHYWHGINYKGLVDYHRNRKKPWDAVCKAYHKLDEDKL